MGAELGRGIVLDVADRLFVDCSVESVEVVGMTYVNSLTVSCSYCNASLGEPCPKVGAHPSRIEAAARAMGLSEDEAKEIAQHELARRIRRYRDMHGASSLDEHTDQFVVSNPEVAATVSEA